MNENMNIVIIRGNASNYNQKNNTFILTYSDYKTLTSKDLISLKDKEYLKEILQEIKEAENKIFNKKEAFIKTIKKHNADCFFDLFGLFVVDEKSFLFIKETKMVND